MAAVEFASSENPGAQFDPMVGATECMSSMYEFNSHQPTDNPFFPSFLASNGKKIPKGLASRIAKKCIEKGMLLLTTSVYEVVRFIPPLNISKEDMESGCRIFEESVREVVGEVEGK
jgi:4-aminobutyrate aminotransferase